MHTNINKSIVINVKLYFFFLVVNLLPPYSPLFFIYSMAYSHFRPHITRYSPMITVIIIGSLKIEIDTQNNDNILFSKNDKKSMQPK